MTDTSDIKLRKCSKCEEMKPATNEYFFVKGRTKITKTPILMYRCKICDNSRKKVNAKRNRSSLLYYYKNKKAIAEQRKRRRETLKLQKIQSENTETNTEMIQVIPH